MLAGVLSTDAAAVHDHLYVAPDGGYDGQFYYRMARAPFDFAATADGIHIDSPIRYQRIAYPALAFLVSAGDGAAVPWALIVVNLAMMAVLVAACCAIAIDSGRDPRWGLVAAGFFGLLMSVGRDLTEPTEVAFLACAILAMRKGRTGWAALAFSGAVLSRETAIVVVGAYLIVMRRRVGDAAGRRPVGATARSCSRSWSSRPGRPSSGSRPERSRCATPAVIR